MMGAEDQGERKEFDMYVDHLGMIHTLTSQHTRLIHKHTP